jgi:hypothetical protein
VADWIEELDKFFKTQKERNESLMPIADEFLTTVVGGAFTELKQGLEKLRKRAWSSYSVGGHFITVSDSLGAEEIFYGIVAQVTGGGITVMQFQRFTSKRDGAQIDDRSILIQPTSSMTVSEIEAEIKGITKESIMRRFLELYKEAIGYTTFKGPKLG